MLITIDKEVIEDVKRCINNPKFSDCILKNTTDFSVAAFILQTLFDAVDEAEAKLAE